MLVSASLLGYPFYWESTLGVQDVEISEDTFIIQRSVAEQYKAAQTGGSGGPGSGAGTGTVYPTAEPPRPLSFRNQSRPV